MPEIVLKGCTPYPLAAYLKGIGLLRIVAGVDEGASAAWRGDHLVLRTRLPSDEVIRFLLEHYQPSPVLAPWNGGSGFYDKDNKKAIQAIAASPTGRLANYRTCLAIAENAMSGVDRGASPKDKQKHDLLMRLRAVLPDYALEWLDAAVLLSGDAVKFPPLLGTGGNDGRLDFTNNYMQRVVELIDPQTGDPAPQASTWLEMALLSSPAPALIRKAIGQFSPGQVGGPNATTGYESKGGMNPWDFVLMIEGALAFAATAVRRNEHAEGGALSYPFTARPVSAGAGNLGAGDSVGSRGELWMPLWSGFASYGEVRALLAEGRVALGRRPARDALDFARAIQKLGGYRGVDRFQRFGILMRSGKAFLATPLEQVRVRSNPESEWIDELDRHEWLSRFRRFAQGENAANRLVMLRKRLEDALFDLASRPASPPRMQALLALLGEVQTTLAASTKAREVVGPVPRLSARWGLAADDGSPAYRIARALASLHGEEGKALPLRAQLFPVHPRFNGWMEAACSAKGAGQDPACRLRLHVPVKGDLDTVLIALLERRLWLADRLDFRDKPLQATSGVDLADLDAFLRESEMDGAIASLLPGLSLCDVPRIGARGSGDGPALAAFGLLKLTVTADAWLRDLAGLAHDQRVPVPPGMVAMLASGDRSQVRRALQVAWRRLRGSGLTPVMPIEQLPELLGIDPPRAAAALMIPLSYGAIRELASVVQEQPQSSRTILSAAL